jgi:hypothetical protein
MGHGFPFPHYPLDGTGSLPFIPIQHLVLPRLQVSTTCAVEVAFVITTETKREWKALVPISMYLIFVAVGVFMASELGYLLSATEKEHSTQPVSRRCRRSHEVHRRKAIRRRQRERCRFKG